MATTQVQDNNKLVKYVQDINREFVRENMFSPYMGSDLTAIIRLRNELKAGGAEMNIPLVAKLSGAGVGSGTLVGNEENIDNYGMRIRIGWARAAVTTKKNDEQKSSIDLFGEAKPMLSDWGKERQRDDIINALMALPSETLPSSDDVTVNGILYETATTTQKNTFNADNQDRLLFGNAVANYSGTHATALSAIDSTNDRFVKSSIKLLKRRALITSPKIKPYKTADGYEWYVCFAGSNTFRDLGDSLETVNKDARAREQQGMDKNPLFVDGDLVYDGVIIRQVPEISLFTTNVWTSLLTAGAGSSRVEPVFLCGQQAAVVGWGQMARNTERTETDYGFIKGTGVEMAYGMAKMFKKPQNGTALTQWGVATGFFSAPTDG